MPVNKNRQKALVKQYGKKKGISIEHALSAKERTTGGIKKGGKKKKVIKVKAKRKN